MEYGVGNIKKNPIYSIFYLLKGDYGSRVASCLEFKIGVQGLVPTISGPKSKV